MRLHFVKMLPVLNQEVALLDHTDCFSRANKLEIFFSDFAKLTKLLTSQRIELLTDLLKDCFEDNKQLALDILTQEKLKSHVKRAVSGLKHFIVGNQYATSLFCSIFFSQYAW